MSRSVSSRGISLITSFEGCRLKAYKALPTEQFWTIGYGHYGSDVIPGMVISQAKAQELLKNDLKIFEKKVNKFDYLYRWSQAEFDALVSFAYNVGSIDKLTANGTRTKGEIAQKMLEYNKSGGKVIAGLTRRRQAEKKLFESQVNKPILTVGCTGSAVRDLQNRLNELNIMGGNLKVDGKFGNCTKSAVIDFQALNNLEKTGIVDFKTWEALG